MTQIADLANESRASRARASTKLDITVLAGGPSEEREVSLQSGAAVAAALVRLGHKVTVRDISPADPSALEVPADFAFIALHGAFGEDGQVQDLLARCGIAFSGSDAKASALAMDKVATKARLAEARIPTPAYHVYASGHDQQQLARWGLPAVVKPVGS
ncbi:MAG: D-alanine--D-alanine ligase family protein, partial [Planctomycetota bacterium]